MLPEVIILLQKMEENWRIEVSPESGSKLSDGFNTHPKIKPCSKEQGGQSCATGARQYTVYSGLETSG